MSEKKEIAKRDGKQVDTTVKLRSALPAVDIYENDDEILVHADMPGVDKSDVSVNIDNGTLSLSGVRRFDHDGKSSWQEFSDIEYVRTFSVPQTIDTDRVEAELRDGVLKLHLPKSEAAKPKLIEINAA